MPVFLATDAEGVCAQTMLDQESEGAMAIEPNLIALRQDSGRI
jgi:hypothetical protein